MTKAYYADMTRYTLNGSTYHQESGPYLTRQGAYDGAIEHLERLGLDPDEFTIDVGLFDIPDKT